MSELFDELARRCHRLLDTSGIEDGDSMDIPMGPGRLVMYRRGKSLYVGIRHHGWGIDYWLIRGDEVANEASLDDMILEPLRRWMVLDDLAGVRGEEA